MKGIRLRDNPRFRAERELLGLESTLDEEQVKESLCKPDQAQFAASAPKSEEPQHLPAKKTEERKKYDREFLLGFRFIAASMQKPEGCHTLPMWSWRSPQEWAPEAPSRARIRSHNKLNKAEKAWKPSIRKATTADPETIKTEELFYRMRSILNKLTPQMFHQLMRQVTELTIDTEERLKGVVDLIFEKAISEPNFSVTYANMCHCLMEFHVPTTGKPGVTVTFRKMLLSRCKTEFEKDKGSDEVVEKKQKQLDASLGEEAKGQRHRRALGNIQFIGQLFKVKMLNENTMHNCIIVKLLRKQDEESLECLCRLLSTIGKDLDSEKAKPPMDQYFNQIEQMVKQRKTSSRIRFMLQDVLDLRRDNWVPRRGDQGPKTIDQIHKEAQLDEHREQIKVQQQLMNKQDNRRWGRNSVPVSKNRPIDTSSLGKISKPSGMGPRGSQQGQIKQPRKIITGVSFTAEVKLNKAEKAWKPSIRKAITEDPETIKTEQMFCRIRSILNKLTPQMFHQLMRQVTELTIDTEERLKGVVDLIFEKAISEPNFSVTYANMCHCLMELHVPTTGKPGVTVTFRKLLLSHCKTEFEKDKGGNEVVEKKQKQLDASLGEEAMGQRRRRALGNIQFIGQLFKVKMLNENTIHNCIIIKLLRKQDEESLECLCRLLSTIGKDLDSEKAKPPMDQYFNQMEQMVKERKTSSRIRFMLQDVLDLRRDNWVPRRGNQGPKTIDQIHKEAQLDEHREQIKVQQQLMNKQDNRRWGRNSVPVSKNRPIDTSSLGKISKETEKNKLEQQFLLDLESICASMQKLHITDVVLEKGCSGDSGSKPAEQDDIKEENFYKWRFRKDLPSLRSLERLRERAEQARKRERRTSVKHGWH